jgi:hypothetical protein
MHIFVLIVNQMPFILNAFFTWKLNEETFLHFYSSVFSLPSVVVSGVAWGWVLGLLLFYVFINDCFPLQCVVDSVCGWCMANFMKLKANETTVISFSGKTNLLLFESIFILIFLGSWSCSWFRTLFSLSSGSCFFSSYGEVCICYMFGE